METIVGDVSNVQDVLPQGEQTDRKHDFLAVSGVQVPVQYAQDVDALAASYPFCFR